MSSWELELQLIDDMCKLITAELSLADAMKRYKFLVKDLAWWEQYYGVTTDAMLLFVNDGTWDSDPDIEEWLATYNEMQWLNQQHNAQRMIDLELSIAQEQLINSALYKLRASV